MKTHVDLVKQSASQRPKALQSKGNNTCLLWQSTTYKPYCLSGRLLPQASVIDRQVAAIIQLYFLLDR